MAALRMIALLLLTCCAGCGTPHATLPTHEKIMIGGELWNLELAMDEEAIRRGLMDRTTLPKDGGMLFIFQDTDYRSFWMANCLIDIDILFLDDRGTISATHEMKVEPPRTAQESQFAYESRLRNYESVYPARFAIELPAGSIQRLQVKPNQRLKMDTQRLKSLRNSADRTRSDRSSS
ncbi:MAG: DUF192 domain-containing protein [Phycisphaerales bacterium]|nr:DUF192 domain-containing protein [Phycisphaerales bacterium]